MKKLLAAVGLLAGMGQAQIGIDVIIRDFPVTHPDFENYSEFKDFIVENSYDGFDGPWKDHGRTCAASNGKDKGDQRQVDFYPDYLDANGLKGAARICEDGKPCFPNPLLPEGLQGSNDPGSEVRYGEFTGCKNGNDKQRGLVHIMKAAPYNCSTESWSNLVLVTPGMVKSQLMVPASLPDYAFQGTTTDHYAYPPKNPDVEGCDARNFDEWFRHTDASREFVAQLVLDPVEGEKNVYEVNYNWNNGGYFPLDTIEGTFGKQSLSIMCPPYNYEWAGSQSDKDNKPTAELCNDWKAQGGPRNPGAAAAAADMNGALGQTHLHNYGFTMSGFANFKYVKGNNEIFEFEGDDDMWIYIDSVLVVDLGGTHLAAPGKLNMDDVAEAFAAIGKPWSDRSLHKLHFFYADRQTDGSNMRIKMTLSEVVEGVFGAPRILKVETKSSTNETYSLLYLNTKLDLEAIQAFIDNPELGYPVLVRKVDGSYMGFRPSSIELIPTDNKADGVVYKVYGSVCTEAGDCSKKLQTGDSLAFNVPKTDDAETNLDLMLPQGSDHKITSMTNAPAKLLNWAHNSTSLPEVEFIVIPENPSVVKPNFAVEQMFTTSSAPLALNEGALGADGKPASLVPDAGVLAAAGLTDPGVTVVHGFGTPSNTALPLNKTGEMILTAYPSSSDEEWLSNLPKGFGLPPLASAGVYGLIDPTVEGPGGGVSFLKNGFPDESNTDGSLRVSPTRCTSNGADVNCLNFSVTAKQPFKMNVTVFDHLGHFITQYREEVTAQEFRNVTQGPNFISDDGKPDANSSCLDGAYGAANTMTKNGQVKVNVNIYPFSNTGRRIGNGVYIVKVDRIDTEYSGCINIGGSPDMGVNKYVRYFGEEKFGWMRTK